MRHSAKQYAEALFAAISDTKPSQQDIILDNFVKVLREHGATGMLGEIEKEFERLDRAARGIKLAEVTTARELSGTAEKDLIDKLNEYTGAKVELKKKIDEGLIGGVVVRLEDEILDGSVRGNLNNLKEELIK